ncbi:MT-A70-like protein [Gongronella butleri]|nr:MT-A70-like protein [Gongronella butleri]
MDPPWPNKSVHRSAGYETQDIYDLFKIPMASLLEPGGLVAVWVTNKPKFRRFIQDKLFPAWGVACVGEWVWVKVTNDGSPVFPLDSPHRKPYEQLILGRRADSSNSHGDAVTPPYHHILMSIPSTQHSRKPPLQDILSRYIQKDARCLEMFARCLMPGWTSWGNECIKFQHETFFERVQDK